MLSAGQGSFDLKCTSEFLLNLILQSCASSFIVEKSMRLGKKKRFIRREKGSLGGYLQFSLLRKLTQFWQPD